MGIGLNQGQRGRPSIVDIFDVIHQARDTTGIHLKVLILILVLVYYRSRIEEIAAVEGHKKKYQVVEKCFIFSWHVCVLCVIIVLLSFCRFCFVILLLACSR